VRAGGLFRRDGAGRDRLGSEVAASLRRARAADRAEDAEAAIEARRGAAEALRGSADDRYAEALGDVLYELGGSLLGGDRPAEAIGALDEAEEAYGRLRSGDRLADVQARRAAAYGLIGAGGSAIVDSQSAVLQHRDRGRSGRGGSGRWGLARVLAVNADVLAAYGDPDLAVASADLAVRLALAGPADPDTEPLRRALAVAVAVHTAHGRHDLADQAGAVARRLGGLAARRPTVLRERSVAHPPVLSVTVATALDAARQRLDRQPPRIGDSAVVRPAVDVELLVPLDRVLVPLGSGARAADAAARLGGTLAGLAAELLPLDAARGARLGLEAHALLAGASRLESELLRYQLPAIGPPWAAILLACSRRAEAGRDPALALDLAAWAAGVIEQLFPATLVDREARTVAVEVLDHHGRLLAERGERDRARDAVQAAARLRAMSTG
jgi:hypothetical protein